MSNPKVSVIILNWNGKNYLERFLPSVCASSYPELEIIVADNASTDDSIDFLNTNFPKVRIIENKQNYGFAGGYNKALEKVHADYYILLNSDVEVTSNWIEPVISLLESDKTVAAAQPKLKDWNRKDFFEYAGAAGGLIDKFGYPFCRGRIFDTIEEDTGQYESTEEVFWASGAAFFIRSSCWKEARGFNPHFFAHMEEIDLCWRLKNLGYKVMYCPDSTVYHIGGGTLNKENPHKTYLNFRNNLLMLYKNLPAGRAAFIISIRFCLDFISLLKFISEGTFKNAFAINKAHFYFLKMILTGSIHKLKDFSSFNHKGFFSKSIVWEYFARGKRKYTELN
ncbi:glycosyltransferase family 2 protein [Rubrolithibacter danxiaensis]|uniref:glycosyltransferase family 2 protein n=1 Tax=Rubrolithibacter danxiaensis TaxID=3390805 RepID=UPI003BF8D1B9